jgi:hypothetical protein
LIETVPGSLMAGIPNVAPAEKEEGGAASAARG